MIDQKLINRTNELAKISKERVNKVEDVLKVGDEVTVKVSEIDNQGRINLTRKDLYTE